MSHALIVQDPHQAGLRAGRQDAALLEQRGEAIEHSQGPAGPRATVARIRPDGYRHARGIDAGALTRQSGDVGGFCEPARPARD